MCINEKSNEGIHQFAEPLKIDTKVRESSTKPPSLNFVKRPFVMINCGWYQPISFALRPTPEKRTPKTLKPKSAETTNKP